MGQRIETSGRVHANSASFAFIGNYMFVTTRAIYAASGTPASLSGATRRKDVGRAVEFREAAF